MVQRLFILFLLLIAPGQTMAQDYGEAPFGLRWGMTPEQVETMGVTLTPLESPHGARFYYLANGLPKQDENAKGYGLEFDRNDRLMVILAHYPLDQFDPVLAALEVKYGAFTVVVNGEKARKIIPEVTILVEKRFIASLVSLGFFHNDIWNSQAKWEKEIEKRKAAERAKNF